MARPRSDVIPNCPPAHRDLVMKWQTLPNITISVEQLADRARISPATVFRYLTGRTLPSRRRAEWFTHVCGGAWPDFEQLWAAATIERAALQLTRPLAMHRRVADLEDQVLRLTNALDLIRQHIETLEKQCST